MRRASAKTIGSPRVCLNVCLHMVFNLYLWLTLVLLLIVVSVVRRITNVNALALVALLS